MSDSLQPPLSMGFSLQEYWGVLPFLYPGDLPDPGIEPTFPVSPALAGRFFSTEPPGKSYGICILPLYGLPKCHHLIAHHNFVFVVVETDFL